MKKVVFRGKTAVLRQNSGVSQVNFNLYYYAENNPVKYTDPDGRKDDEVYYYNNFSIKITDGPSNAEKLNTLSTNTKSHIEKLSPSIQKQAVNMMYYLKKAGINAEIVASLRTNKEQDELYQKGRRGIDEESIVTYAKGGDSIHNYGLAFDVEVYDEDGKKDWNFKGENWKKVIAEGKLQGFESGSEWTRLYDPPHFQDTKGKNLSELKKEAENEK